jgi:hypothetical protein
VSLDPVLLEATIERCPVYRKVPLPSTCSSTDYMNVQRRLIHFRMAEELLRLQSGAFRRLAVQQTRPFMAAGGRSGRT